MPQDDRADSPSRLRRAARALGAGAAEDGNVVLLVRAGIALVVVTAALTRYVVELAAEAAQAAWSRRPAMAAQADRNSEESVTIRR
jgi:hypothetical protein